MTAQSPNSVLSRRERRKLEDEARQENPATSLELTGITTNTETETAGMEHSQTSDISQDEAGDEQVPVDTASLPTALPLAMPDTSWEEDIVDPEDGKTAGTGENRMVSFDPFESIIAPTARASHSDLDPAVSLALLNRTIEDIMTQDGLDHGEAILKAEEEEAIRANYFRTESPERAEQVRLEREAQEEQEEAEKTAKRKAIADRATHTLKAKQFSITALVTAMLAILTGVAFYLLGGV